MLVVGLCAGLAEASAFDVCGYTKYCGFCDKECPKCSSSDECLHPVASKRPPNCGYCKYCPLCHVCGTAKTMCKTLGSWVDWASDALFAKHADDAKNAPNHDTIAADLKKANIKPDEL